MLSRPDLRPRRPLLYVASIAVLSALGAVGCAAAFAECVASRPVSAPCEPSTVAPAVYCRNSIARHDGCRWRCGEWFPLPRLEQQEWTLYVPDASGGLTPVKAVR